MLLQIILMMSSLSFAQMCPPPSTKNCGRLGETAPANGAASAPATAPAQAPASQGIDATDAKLLTPAVRSVMELTNQIRIKNGLQPLAFDPHCTRAARDHAIDTGKNRLRGHVGSDGSQLVDRYKRYSSDFSMLSENWALLGDENGTTLTPRKLVEAWMGSPSHKANILDPTAKKIGVGLYRIGIELIGVQCFSAPAQ